MKAQYDSTVWSEGEPMTTKATAASVAADAAAAVADAAAATKAARKRNLPVVAEDVSPMKLRRGKGERRFYSEDLEDDEAKSYIDGQRSFDLNEKVSCQDAYDSNLVRPMKGDDFDVEFFQRGDFNRPLVFHSKEGLGLKMPDSDFTVGDVKSLVGSGRQIDVMDTTTQKGATMPLWQFVRYYEDSKRRDTILNVISLEFSRTKLAPIVEGPRVIREVDWVDVAWPAELKAAHRDATNNLATMRYPKVQKYCLMSVAGCYTDFHVDFGGTSVWYHVLRGSKIFWLIPPTEGNLLEFERWTLSGFQFRSFFADRVKDCQRFRLKAGDTFMIPTGWIHAVYTPRDSLVFGGNFLHSYSISEQLRIANLEVATRVPTKFRYPFFLQIHWFVLERYVRAFTGISHLAETSRKKVRKKTAKTQSPNLPDRDASSFSGPQSPELESDDKYFPWVTTLDAAPSPPDQNCDKDEDENKRKKKKKKLSIFSFWESQVLSSAPPPRPPTPPLESTPKIESDAASTAPSATTVKTEPASEPRPPTSTLPPKMVIAIDHSYAKNWEDLAFSPWNAQKETTPPAPVEAESNGRVLEVDLKPEVPLPAPPPPVNGTIIAEDLKGVAVANQGIKERSKKTSNRKKERVKPVPTIVEVHGLRSLLEALDKNPPRDVPEAIEEPAQLLERGWKLLRELERGLKSEDPEHGVTGVPVLFRLDGEDG